MPVVAIPFKAPAPFEIPPVMAEPIASADRETAAARALDLLTQIDAGDALAIVWMGADGTLQAGPWASPRGGANEALKGLDPNAGNFLANAVSQEKPLLYMGDLAADDAGTFPPSIHRYLRGGQAAGNIGFLYVYPLVAPTGPSPGAMLIHRTLAEGPLNHDQPAIAHALAHLLGQAAAH